MIDKLKTRLATAKGFTLVELLIVIAIIAILVLIVVVAINPAERLREAADRRAAANVRAAGTLLSTCVTRQNGNLASCASISDVEAPAGGDGDIPNGVSIGVVGSPVTEVCFWQQGRTVGTRYYIYSTDDQQSVEIASVPDATSCPDS